MNNLCHRDIKVNIDRANYMTVSICYRIKYTCINMESLKIFVEYAVHSDYEAM